MPVLLHHFNNIPNNLKNHCLCNGYSTLCPKTGEINFVQLKRWSLFDLGIASDIHDNNYNCNPKAGAQTLRIECTFKHLNSESTKIVFDIL